MELKKHDVKPVFLNEDLDGQIYMQPEGFKEPDKEEYVCLFNNSIVWLESVSQTVVQRFNSSTVSHGYMHLDGSHVLLTLYVDDMLIAAKIKKEIGKLKSF